MVRSTLSALLVACLAAFAGCGTPIPVADGANADTADAALDSATAAGTDATLDAAPDVPVDIPDEPAAPDVGDAIDAPDVTTNSDAGTDATSDTQDTGATWLACAPTDCSDGDPCTVDVCLHTTGTCAHKALTGCPNGCQADSDPSCNDGNPCTADTCDKFTGTCAHAVGLGCPCAGSCDDGNFCTSDACDKSVGKCEHTAVTGCCTTTADCNDGTACTDDACDLTLHTCMHVPAAGCCLADAECVATDPCKIGECTAGECVFVINGDKQDCCSDGVNSECDDKNVCTIDSCATQMPGGWMQCSHVCGGATCCMVNDDCVGGNPNPCTLDLCLNNCCQHVLIATCCLWSGNCDDGDACTIDACPKAPGSEAGTCSHTLPPPGVKNKDPIGCIPALCDDGNPCTDDTCSCTGYCENTPKAGCTLPCDVTGCNVMGNCVMKACDSTGQCVHTNACDFTPCGSSLDCEDGDLCTADLCTATGCQFKVVTCDDGNQCTLDACLAGGCTHVFVLGCVAPKGP